MALGQGQVGVMLAQWGQPQEDGSSLVEDGEWPGVERPECPGGWGSCRASGLVQLRSLSAQERARAVSGVTLRMGGCGQRFAGGEAASEDKTVGRRA